MVQLIIYKKKYPPWVSGVLEAQPHINLIRELSFYKVKNLGWWICISLHSLCEAHLLRLSWRLVQSPNSEPSHFDLTSEKIRRLVDLFYLNSKNGSIYINLNQLRICLLRGCVTVFNYIARNAFQQYCILWKILWNQDTNNLKLNIWRYPCWHS